MGHGALAAVADQEVNGRERCRGVVQVISAVVRLCVASVQLAQSRGRAAPLICFGAKPDIH